MTPLQASPFPLEHHLSLQEKQHQSRRKLSPVTMNIHADTSSKQVPHSLTNKSSPFFPSSDLHQQNKTPSPRPKLTMSPTLQDSLTLHKDQGAFPKRTPHELPRQPETTVPFFA
ncbi:hypothetical protein Dimus_008834 [Dionaea muscipula]